MTPPGTDNPAPKDTTPPEGNLQADIDSLLQDVAKSTERIETGLGTMPGVGAPLASDAETAKLAETVNGLLGEKPGAAKEPEALAAIENLDAQLAELTAQLLDTNKPASAPAGDDVQAAQAIVNETSAHRAEAPAVVAPGPTSPPVQASRPASAPVVPAAASVEVSKPEPVAAPAVLNSNPAVAPFASEPPATVTAAPSVPPSSSTSHSNPPSHSPSNPPSQPASPAAPAGTAAVAAEGVASAESAALAESVVEPPEPGALVSMMAAMSKPLQGKPKGARLVVGLISIQSAILGLLVWGFVIFRPPPEVEETAPFDLNGDLLPRPVEPKVEGKPAAKDGHEASGGGHGAPAKGKAPPKKDSAKKDAPKKAAKTESKGH